jgi:hypothetical protein
MFVEANSYFAQKNFRKEHEKPGQPVAAPNGLGRHASGARTRRVSRRPWVVLSVRQETSMLRLTFVLLGCALLAACSPDSRQSAADIPPSAAVIGAGEHPLRGTFRLQVRGAGRRDGQLYLNSEADYRDQRCLTVAIPDPITAELARVLGGDPAVILKDRTIRVSGVARKVKIIFVEKDGAPSDSYYFQTHVDVTNASQIEVL